MTDWIDHYFPIILVVGYYGVMIGALLQLFIPRRR